MELEAEARFGAMPALCSLKIFSYVYSNGPNGIMWKHVGQPLPPRDHKTRAVGFPPAGLGTEAVLQEQVDRVWRVSLFLCSA